MSTADVHPAYWTGKFIVVNGTYGAIENVQITHNVGATTNWLNAPRLESGQASPTTDLNGQASHPDKWAVSFRVAATGQLHTRTNKQCDFEYADRDQIVTVILHNDHFSVVPAVTSSCMDAYD